MTRHDVTILTNFLHGLYGERFPGLTPGMAQLWYDDLQPLDAALVTRAARRWARHHTLKSPTLDELLEQVEWVQEQDRKARLPEASAGPQSFDDFLAWASGTPARSHDDRRFARAHQILYARLRGNPERWTRAHCAAACQGWAARLQASAPGLAASLVKAAEYFAKVAAEHGESLIPAMTGVSLPTLGEDHAVTPLPIYDRDEPCPHEHYNTETHACNDCGEILEAAAAD